MTLATADTAISVQDQIDAAKFILEHSTAFTPQQVTDAKALLASVIYVEEA